MVKLTLTELLSKQEIIDLWNEVHTIIIDDGENVVFQLINNSDLEIDTYGLIDDGEWTPRTDDFLVLKWDRHIFVFEDKEIVRIRIINKSEYEASRIVVSTYDDMMIVVHDGVYYHETESNSKPLELVAVVNAPYHNEGDHLSGSFNFGEANINICFDVSAEDDVDGLYYYFKDNGDSSWTEWEEDEERSDLIYEYETKIAKAKRNNDTEAQYYYQDKLDELLREDDIKFSLINKKEE